MKSKIKTSNLSIKKILSIMPHRYPFLMVDRVVFFEVKKRLTAIKNVTINENYFQGHFPGNPIMPGVLQLEAMAQASGLLILQSMVCRKNTLCFFMSSDRVKFRHPVIPGDQMLIEIELEKVKNDSIFLFKGICKVEGKIVSSAELKLFQLNISE